MIAASLAPHVDLVLSRLSGVRASGNGHTARCPAHEDRVQSLSVTVGTDGKILCHCFAGCTTETIVKSIGLTMADLFPESRPTHQARRRPDLYPSRNVDGTLEAEHYLLRLPDGTKRGWWKLPGATQNGLQGRRTATLPFYRSEYLAQLAPGSVVIVTEGEKAADAAAQLGYAAVGTVTGAGNPIPIDDVLRTLEGFDVVLWPDGDAPGRAHMRELGERLAELSITARILEWTDAPDKGDAADYQGSPDELRALVDGAAPYEPPPAPLPPCECPQCADRVYELERRLEEAHEHHRQTMAMFRSSQHKPNEKMAIVTAVYRWAEEVSHGADPAEPVRVTIATMAESMGVSAQRASVHLKKWATAGLLRLDLTRQWVPEAEEYRTETYLSLPLGSPAATLTAACVTELDRPGSWGGSRPCTPEIPTCSDHPDEPTMLDWQLRSRDCGETLLSGRVDSALVPSVVESLMLHLERSEEPGPTGTDAYVPVNLGLHLETSGAPPNCPEVRIDWAVTPKGTPRVTETSPDPERERLTNELTNWLSRAQPVEDPDALPPCYPYVQTGTASAWERWMLDAPCPHLAHALELIGLEHRFLGVDSPWGPQPAHSDADSRRSA